jgi:hypothetical protein
MGYHPRIETSDYANLITTRTRNSELWFVNNKPLEEATLGYTAKYAKRYNITLYGFAIEGNHLHAVSQIDHGNRGNFMRDLKSSIARAIPRYAHSYPGGSVWGRRYSNEFLPSSDDIENWFFYTVLQSVQDGLVEKISEYPGYNCFHDAIWGIKRTFKVVNWKAYNEALRWKSEVRKIDYIETHTLEYARLPGYEHLSRKEYAHLMIRKLEERRQAIVSSRRAEGKGFAGRDVLRKTPPGARPRSTKVSTRDSHRPRVLCVCPIRRTEAVAWYFSVYFDYKAASHAYRCGDRNAVFPAGTYKPYVAQT